MFALACLLLLSPMPALLLLLRRRPVALTRRQ